MVLYLLSLCKIHVHFEHIIILCGKFELKQYLKLFIIHYTSLNFGLYKAHSDLKAHSILNQKYLPLRMLILSLKLYLMLKKAHCLTIHQITKIPLRKYFI